MNGQSGNSNGKCLTINCQEVPQGNVYCESCLNFIDFEWLPPQRIKRPKCERCGKPMGCGVEHKQVPVGSFGGVQTALVFEFRCGVCDVLCPNYNYLQQEVDI